MIRRTDKTEVTGKYNNNNNKIEIVKGCSDLLEELEQDITVPRNIRKATSEIKNKLLNEDKSLIIRVSTAISDLEELTTNPITPSHIRVLLWNIVSQLETIAVEE